MRRYRSVSQTNSYPFSYPYRFQRTVQRVNAGGNNPVLMRLIDKVRQDLELAEPAYYDRSHNRHNHGPHTHPNLYNRTHNRHRRGR